MTGLRLLLSLLLVLPVTIPVEQLGNAPNTTPPTPPTPLTSHSSSNTSTLEEPASHPFSEHASLNGWTVGELTQFDQPGNIVHFIKLNTKEINNGPRFSCARGAICNINITEIVNESGLSNVTVSSESAGLVFNVSKDGKWIVGLPITHGILPFSLKYDSRNGTTTVVDFKVFINGKQHPTHFFFLTLTKPELPCQEHPHLCLKLLEDVSRSLGGPSSTLTLTRFSKDKKGTTIVSFYNNTLSLNECEKGKIEKMRVKMAADNGTEVNGEFSKQMGNEYAIVSFFFKPMKSCQDYSSIPLPHDTDAQPSSPSIFVTVISAMLLVALISIFFKGIYQFCKKDQRQDEGTNQIELGLLENQVEEDVMAYVEDENIQNDANDYVLVDESNLV
ncbi:hypothetical protein CAEBREN_24258 [Caenorhabditis brenneri]|uniref:Peptidase S72 domain-containing protein n=1 Tax=Caenorhabditis brenneri TaxID=135651 RepID=G0MH69_CAEBE|nr:hypothetical protein CAEBREN_24258 [Caenorhabditis brenneri]